MKRIALIFIIILLMTVPAGYILAAPAQQTIGEGESYDGDIEIFGGEQLIINAGGTVNGDITVYGGSVNIAGQVNGDITVMGGELALSGNLNGDLVLFGGNLQIAETAILEGDCIALGTQTTASTNTLHCETFAFPPIPSFTAPISPNGTNPLSPPNGPTPPDHPAGSTILSAITSFTWNIFAAISQTILMGLLALLTAAIFPRHLHQIGEAIHQKPIASGIVGTLTSVASVSLIILLLVILAITCVGLLLYPAVFLLALVPLVAALMGWVALGNMFGRAIFNRLQMKQSQLMTTVLGTAGLTFGLGLLQAFGFDFGRDLITTILLLIGLGAAALTQFGTRPYPPLTLPAVNPAKVESVLETLPNDNQ